MLHIMLHITSLCEWGFQTNVQHCRTYEGDKLSKFSLISYIFIFFVFFFSPQTGIFAYLYTFYLDVLYTLYTLYTANLLQQCVEANVAHYFCSQTVFKIDWIGIRMCNIADSECCMFFILLDGVAFFCHFFIVVKV